MEDIMGPGKNTNQFRQAMGVTVIGLAEVLQYLENPWLLEHHIRIMEMVLVKGNCTRLRCVLKEHG